MASFGAFPLVGVAFPSVLECDEALGVKLFERNKNDLETTQKELASEKEKNVAAAQTQLVQIMSGRCEDFAHPLASF